MADFPLTSQFESSAYGAITTASVCCCCGFFAFSTQVASGGAVWPAANRALYLPFTINSFATVFQISFRVTVQSGNLDVGLYTEQGVRLVSSGSTGVAAVGVQTVNTTDTALAPGTYFMAMNVDNTTAAFWRFSSPDILTLQTLGIQQQAVGAVALPDPATFANPASAYIPMISLGLRSTSV